ISNQAMLIIQKEHGEDFLVAMAQLGTEVAAHQIRTGEQVALLHAGGQMAASHLQYRLQLRIFGGAQAMATAEVRLIGFQQLPQSAIFAKQIPREVDGGFTDTPHPQEDGEEFSIRKRLGTLLEQFFAGAFGLRPLCYGHLPVPCRSLIEAAAGSDAVVSQTARCTKTALRMVS